MSNSTVVLRPGVAAEVALTSFAWSYSRNMLQEESMPMRKHWQKVYPLDSVSSVVHDLSCSKMDL